MLTRRAKAYSSSGSAV